MSDIILKKKDFKSDQEVRWCPGCDDYGILNSVQGVFARLGVPREKQVIVSGIGCSSRFPYYMNTYGFHGIHGRAAAIATGVKIANPDLSVWVVTGDGDALSIGGNHLIHVLRRNVDINILLFNNEIYGLTKGQYSPTSPVGTKSKTTPFGSVDRPFNPINLALGAGGTFVARTSANNARHMESVFEAAAAHHGTSFVEIYQNCVIFNNGAFADFLDKDHRDDKTVDLRPGEPLVFGKERDKGLIVDCGDVRVGTVDEASVWRVDTRGAGPAVMLADMDGEPDLPNALGIFRQVDAPVYDAGLHGQVERALEASGKGDLKDLLYTPDTWTID